MIDPSLSTENPHADAEPNLEARPGASGADLAQVDATVADPALIDAGAEDRGQRVARGIWREWIVPLLTVIVVMSFLRSAVADWNDVPTGSMKPTIVEGDRIFVNKAAYDLRVPFTLKRLASWGDPHRGDIVVLFSPDDGRRLVKRVIGVPGDQIELREGRLYINSEPAEYGPLEQEIIGAVERAEQAAYRFANEGFDGLEHAVMLAPWILTSSYFGPTQVPADSYFVMGDNRGHSRDSRVFGFVDRRQIVGRATAVVYSKVPGSFMGLRGNRFFHGLR